MLLTLCAAVKLAPIQGPMELSVHGAVGKGVSPQSAPQEKHQGLPESAVTIITRRDIPALSHLLRLSDISILNVLFVTIARCQSTY